MKTIAMVINKIEWMIKQTVQYVAVNGIFRSLARSPTDCFVMLLYNTLPFGIMC